MKRSRFDVLVVGGGPAGSVAAFVLARGGARVAVVDKADFPRDKACGDLVGPRGLQVLSDLRLPLPSGPDLGDMLVVGPTGHRVRLPSAPGLTYPGHATAVTRTVLDDMLHDAALEAGATELVGRVETPVEIDGRIDGYELSTGETARADFVIGADGATSRVATSAAMVDPDRMLWGFAVRTYLPQATALPAIVLWEPERWRGFPGYGWVFPGEGGQSNVGLGVGTRSDRKAGAHVLRALPEFLDHLHRVGLLDEPPPSRLARPLGGWLKMGVIGTRPAAGRVLLAGDSAGLVNPLQGEGIAQAMGSGRAAAEAVLFAPGRAAEEYSATIAADHLPYHRITATVQAALVGRPKVVAAVSRLLTTVGRVPDVAGGWAVFWNELTDGAPAGRHRAIAAAATKLGAVMTARSGTARWFDKTLDPAGPGRAVAPGGR